MPPPCTLSVVRTPASGLPSSSRSVAKRPIAIVGSEMGPLLVPQERPRMPLHGDLLGVEPDALGIAESQLAQGQGTRERSREPDQRDVASGEPLREPHDRGAAGVGIAADEHTHEQRRTEQRESTHGDAGDLEAPAHQNASPRPT